MLGSLYLLVLKVQLMPLIPRVKVVSVDHMMFSTGCRLKHLICLIIVGLQETFEAEIGVAVLSSC